MTARCSKSHRPLWFHQNISNRLIKLQPAHPQGMAKGINIGGVAITATVRRRVTEDGDWVTVNLGVPVTVNMTSSYLGPTGARRT
ncbi:MAG: hypothetical protein EOQ69_25295 [Mesorhizobium sp.]|nr:MAG: hypothetical protein EOQ69_25295 [Mesorhizobium sp.]